MGLYINNIGNVVLGASFTDKCTALEQAGATIFDPIFDPTTFKEGLVCVVDNGYMAAEGYAFDEEEFDYFIDGMGGRPHQWYDFPEAKKWAKKT